MTPSLAGLCVCAALFALGYRLGSPFLIGFFASLPFGATAFLTIGGPGGSSPVIFTLFALGLIASITLRKSVLRDLGVVFHRDNIGWLLCFLGAYAAASAIIFPRLFAGQTSALVPLMGEIITVPLGSVPGNITQTAYLLIGIAIFFAVRIILLRPENFRLIARGFLVFSAIHACLGLIDLAAKLSGLGDVMSYIRTANYALLTEVEEAGFARIVGGHPEASSFGGMSLICLAFCYTYWRSSGAPFAFALTVVLLLLTCLSTSSTAYAGLAVLALFPLKSLLAAVLNGRFATKDLLLLALGATTVIFVLALYLYNPNSFAPITKLIQTTLIDKQSSESGVGRLYWNTVSLQAFLDTGGIGIGMGSSRASSWPIAALSQLGLIGGLVFAILTYLIGFGLGSRASAVLDKSSEAVASSVRAAALALLATACLSGTSADPGILYFVSLAVIVAYRTQASRKPIGSFGFVGISSLKAPREGRS